MNLPLHLPVIVCACLCVHLGNLYVGFGPDSLLLVAINGSNLFWCVFIDCAQQG